MKIISREDLIPKKGDISSKTAEAFRKALSKPLKIVDKMTVSWDIVDLPKNK